MLTRTAPVSRAARAGLSLAVLTCVVASGCGWPGGGDVFLRNAPYPYEACAAVDDGAEVSPLEDRGVAFAWSGRTVGTVGQDAMCSLIDRARQLWEALVFLVRNREWEGRAFFGNRPVEPALAPGSLVHAFKTCVGRVPVAGSGIPEHVAADMAEAVIYELCAKGGLTIIGSPPGAEGERKPAVLQEAVSEYLALAAEERRLWLVDLGRLLSYDFVRRNLVWTAGNEDGQITIRIEGVDDGHGNAWVPTLDELDGITFYTPSAVGTRVLLAGREVTGLAMNPRDRTRRESVTIH